MPKLKILDDNLSSDRLDIIFIKNWHFSQPYKKKKISLQLLMEGGGFSLIYTKLILMTRGIRVI